MGCWSRCGGVCSPLPFLFREAADAFAVVRHPLRELDHGFPRSRGLFPAAALFRWRRAGIRFLLLTLTLRGLSGLLAALPSRLGLFSCKRSLPVIK